jgi:hypothetical protein
MGKAGRGAPLTTPLDPPQYVIMPIWYVQMRRIKSFYTEDIGSSIQDKMKEFDLEDQNTFTHRADLMDMGSWVGTSLPADQETDDWQARMYE